jgi:DNA-binding response OmpR family regulator
MPGVLVIEDEPLQLSLASEYLTIEGFTVHRARTNAEALEILAREAIDVVLADVIASPGGTRASLMALQEHARQVPIIVASGQAEMHRADPADYGVAGILPKPYDLDQLVALIRSTLHL